MATGTPATETLLTTVTETEAIETATENAASQTIDLQQQVARLQALLEVSRQVHSTTREDEVLETVLRIVVRELEMSGAAFSNSELSYGEAPRKSQDGNFEGVLLYPLDDREGKR